MSHCTLWESFRLKVLSVSWPFRSSVKCQAKYFWFGPITTNSLNACCPLNVARNWFPYTAVSSPSACISCRLSPRAAVSLHWPCPPTSDTNNIRVCAPPDLGDRPVHSCRCHWYRSMSTIVVPLGELFAIASRVNHTD